MIVHKVSGNFRNSFVKTLRSKKNHNVNNPALVSDNGNVLSFLICGRWHRLNEPAWYNKNFKIVGRFLSGGAHNITGPAIITGNKLQWYINDVEYLEEEYNEILKINNAEGFKL